MKLCFSFVCARALVPLGRCFTETTYWPDDMNESTKLRLGCQCVPPTFAAEMALAVMNTWHNVAKESFSCSGGLEDESKIFKGDGTLHENVVPDIAMVFVDGTWRIGRIAEYDTHHDRKLGSCGGVPEKGPGIPRCQCSELEKGICLNRAPSSSYSIIFLILLFLFNYSDDNLDDTATSHYGDATAPSPNIIFVYEVILVLGFSLVSWVKPMLKAHPAPNPTISFYILYHSLKPHERCVKNSDNAFRPCIPCVN